MRAHYAQQLPLACPYCGLMIQPGEQFDLDHAVPRELGGQDDQVRPAHPKCNRAAGGRLGNPRRSNPYVALNPTGNFARDVLLGIESRDRDW